jgi:intracellular multiplication protein IcmO
LEKRVKEEARSIVANCNIKIFGKLGRPDHKPKNCLKKQSRSSFVTEVKSFNTQLDSITKNYYDSASAGVETRSHATYEELRGFKQGEAVICFGERSIISKMYYANPGHAKAMRVTRFIPLPPPTETLLKHVGDIKRLRDLLCKKGWSAAKADVASQTPDEITGALRAFKQGQDFFGTSIDASMMAVAGAYASVNPVDLNAPPATSTPPIQTETAVPPEPEQSDAPAAPAAPTASASPFGNFAKKPDVPGDAAPLAVAASAVQKSPLSSFALPPLSEQVEQILEEAAHEAHDMLVKEDA